MSRRIRLVSLVMVVGPVHAGDWPAPKMVADLSSINFFDPAGAPAEFTAMGDFVYF